MFKTREQLIDEACQFVYENARSNFRGELIHKAKFFSHGVIVTLYHKYNTHYEVILSFIGLPPSVVRQDVVTSVRSQVM